MPTTGSVPLQQVIPGQLIASALWNNEFANVANLLDFSGIGGYESTDSIMQIQTNPYPGSVTSHATSGAGEIERIRFQLAAILGTDFWYKPASASLVSMPPIGAIIDWPSNTIPTAAGGNWTLCDGRALSRTTYATLYGVIGGNFGGGDGSTTFNVPNYTDRMSIGAGGTYALAQTGGSATPVNVGHSHTVNAHTHDLSLHTHLMKNHTHSGLTHTHSVSRDGWGSENDFVSGRLATGSGSGTSSASGDKTTGGNSNTDNTGVPSDNTSNGPNPNGTGNTAPGTDSQLSTVPILNPYLAMYKMIRIL